MVDKILVKLPIGGHYAPNGGHAYNTVLIPSYVNLLSNRYLLTLSCTYYILCTQFLGGRLHHLPSLSMIVIDTTFRSPRTKPPLGFVRLAMNVSISSSMKSSVILKGIDVFDWPAKKVTV